jgi:hypothetical protein
VDDQPTTEHDVVEITDNTIVDQLEITTQHPHNQHAQPQQRQTIHTFNNLHHNITETTDKNFEQHHQIRTTNQQLDQQHVQRTINIGIVPTNRNLHQQNAQVHNERYNKHHSELHHNRHKRSTTTY